MTRESVYYAEERYPDADDVPAVPLGNRYHGKVGLSLCGLFARGGADLLAAAAAGPYQLWRQPLFLLSTFAGNPYLIDLDLLVKDGLLTKADLADIHWGDDPERVDYGAIFTQRFPLLRKAFARGREKLAAELDPEHGPAAVKRMYTTWVEPSGVHSTLDDYAHRQLSGLMDYYYGRWTDFLYRQER